MSVSYDYFILLHFGVWNYSVKPNEHWTSLLGQGHGEE
jgi:hypothetical protein